MPDRKDNHEAHAVEGATARRPARDLGAAPCAAQASVKQPVPRPSSGHYGDVGTPLQVRSETLSTDTSHRKEGPLIPLTPAMFNLDALDDQQVEALTVLLDDVRVSAELTAFGTYALREELNLAVAASDSLRTRAAKSPAQIVCVIAGLPRTGTTLLHNLMAFHPELRTLRGWEALAPFDSELGIRRAHERRAVAERLSPPLIRLHAPAIHTAEESNVLTVGSFRSWQLATVLHVPHYAEWLATTGQMAAHRWESAVLSQLGPSEQWLTKSPFFCLDYASLRRAHPQALVVEIHREDSTARDSWMALVGAARSVYSSQPVVDPYEWSNLFEGAGSPGGPTVRLNFRDLVADPVECCEHVLTLLGLGVPNGFDNAVREFVAADRLRT